MESSTKSILLKTKTELLLAVVSAKPNARPGAMYMATMMIEPAPVNSKIKSKTKTNSPLLSPDFAMVVLNSESY